MSQPDEWSPDQPGQTDAFEQGDEAIDEAERVDPEFAEDLQLDPSLDPTLQADDRELEESDAKLGDPEALATLEGGIDDPDGIGEPTERETARHGDDGGWDLDTPLTGGSEPNSSEDLD